MPRTLPPDHPIFGPCIAVRRKGVADWGLYLILIFLVTLLAIGLLLGGIIVLLFDGNLGGLIAAPIGLGLLVLDWLCVLHLLRVAEFYHEGAVLRILRRRREFPYPSVTSLTYSLTRQYAHGIYAGTALKLYFTTADGRRFRFTGVHKERPVGASIVGLFGKTFRGEDELDVVRDIIASHVAETLLARLSADGSILWCGRALITTNGLTPVSGPREGTLVPWSAIGAAITKGGNYALFEHGQNEPFLTLQCKAKNFYPCLELFKSLVPPPADPQPGVPVATGV